MLKRVDNAVYTAFVEAGDDATFKPGRIDLGLADEGVGYALDENNADLVTDEMQAQVEELKAGVMDGSVEVHDYYTDNACPL
jgi:basic membrane protein A